jgi:hypothetical protein
MAEEKKKKMMKKRKRIKGKVIFFLMVLCYCVSCVSNESRLIILITLQVQETHFTRIRISANTK